jgi:hypothetical protein
MKKIALFCIAGLFSGVSMANGKFTSSNGYFVVPKVNVDDQTFYDSVTLQLNFTNGTFSVVNAKPKPPTIFETPLEPQFNAEGYTIGLLGCESSGSSQITCHLQVVNNEADRELRVFANNGSQVSLLFDNLNNSVTAASLTFANKTSTNFVETTLFQGQPVKISMVFTGININASSISTLKLYCYDPNSRRFFYGTFKDIDF